MWKEELLHMMDFFLDVDSIKTGIQLLNPSIFLYILMGISYGMICGAIPGISSSLAISLVLVPTFYLPLTPAIIFLSSVYTASIYGGGISAILLNIPGTPGAVATTIDGYKLCRQGREAEALGYGLAGSFIGCIFSYLLIVFFMVPIGRIALMFGPSEMLMLIVFALTTIGLVHGSIIKGLIAGLFGLILGTIGTDPLMGMSRGTWGYYELLNGIPIVAILVGVFAFPELFFLLDREFVVDESSNNLRGKTNSKEILKGFVRIFKYKMTVIRSGIIGIIVGLLPATGGTLSALIAQSVARMTSKDPKAFETGSCEGVTAAETANNASEGGAMATMMAFGIPGSGSTAALMAAFMMHGMVPGPYLIRDNMPMVYAILLSNFIQAFVMVGIAILFLNYAIKVIYFPTKILIPAITALAFIGTLALQGFMVDLAIVLIIGVLAYFLRKFDYPLISIVIGLFLGSSVEAELLRTYLLFSKQPEMLLYRPIFLILFIATVLCILWPRIAVYRKRKAKATA
jgi:putative tricarboxylic transport membrane protein